MKSDALWMSCAPTEATMWRWMAASGALRERAKAARAEENRRANALLEARRAAIDEVNGLEGTARKALLEQRLGYGQRCERSRRATLLAP